MFKIILFGLCLIIATIGRAQNTPNISSTGIGEIKVNMTLNAVNQLTGANLVALKSESDSGVDSLYLVYKNMPLLLMVTNLAEANGNLQPTVVGIKVENVKIATRSGITLGAKRFDVIKKLDGYRVEMRPYIPYLETDEKDLAVVILWDDQNGTYLTFFFKNNILYGFEINVNMGC